MPAAINSKIMLPISPPLRDKSIGVDEGGSLAKTDKSDKAQARIVSMMWRRFPCGSFGGPAEQSCPILGHGSEEDRLPNGILTIAGAAQMLGVSQKRFANMISEEKKRLGRAPDFVCDAAGKMRMRILRDELMEWMRAKPKKRGRPFKRMPQ